MSDESQYPGSQAFNQSANTNESVTRNTGSLTLSKTIVSLRGVREGVGFELALSYGAGSPGMLGCPSGWGFGLAFVVPGSSVTAHGRSSVIDPYWSDDLGYSSGLRYVNDHGVLFETMIPAQPLPSGRPGTYSYRLRGNEGSIDYFDALGKLLEHADVFGNHISYTYMDQLGTPFSTCLDTIVDSFGQTVTFQYGPSSIVVTAPDGAATTITYSSGGVQTVVDPVGNVTAFTYSSAAGHPVIVNIAYPTGLQTNLEYTSITFLNGDGSAGAFAAVSDHHHCDPSGAFLDHTRYAYGFLTAGNTFTGAAAGYRLGTSGDALMESNNVSYRYDVSVTRLDERGTALSVSQVFYDYLHLPMREEHLTVADGVISPGFLAEYTYAIDPNLSARVVNYAQPVQSDQSVYSPSAQAYLPLRRATASYDPFGQLLVTEELVYDPSTQAFVSQAVVEHTWVEAAWGGEMPSTEITIDQVTGRQTCITHQLTADQASIAASAVSYRVQAQDPWSPWKTKTFTYDTEGRALSTSLAWSPGTTPPPDTIVETGSTHSYTFDPATSTLTVATTDPLGATTTRSYDVSGPGGAMTQVVSPGGFSATYEYDAIGRLVRDTDQAGNVTTTTHTVYGTGGINSVVATGPTGYVIAKQFDCQGHEIVSLDNGDPTAPVSSSATRVLGRTTYDAMGRVATSTDGIGLTVTSVYDGLSRLIQSTDAAGNVAAVVYDDAAMTTTSLVNGDVRSVKAVDGLGRTISEAQYADSADTTATTSRLTENTYDGMGRPIHVVSSSVPLHGGSSETLYETWLTYDVESKTTTETYTGTHGPTATVRRTIRRDIFGNPVVTSKQTDYADGRSLTRVGDVPSYDIAGRLVGVTNGLGRSEKYEYDVDGRLTTRHRLDGTVFSHTYDALGHLLATTAGDLTISHTYLANGRVRSTSSGDQTMTFGYAMDGGAASVTFPDGRTQTYELDEFSRVIGLVDASGATTTTTFDAWGRVAARQHGDDRVTFTYGTVNHTFGALTGDVLTGQAAMTRTVAVDGYGRPSRVVVADDAGRTVLETDYVRDDADRVTQLTLSSQTSQDPSVNSVRSSGYDALGQLIGTTTTYPGGAPSVSSSWQYDGNFNVIESTDGDSSRQFTFNAGDQLVLPGVTYDENGRMVAGPDGMTYAYNAFDQLVRASDAVRGVSVAYEYYPDGSLARTTSGTVSSGFYYNTGEVNVTSQTSSGDEALTSFFLDGSARRAAYEPGGEPAYFLAEKSSTAMLQKGGKTDAVQYDSYGAITNDASLPANLSFSWNGEYLDQPTGLVYLRSRYYHPALMRFMTMDSLMTENRYSYCEGDPLNRIDPGGHSSIGDVFGMVAGAVVGLIATVVTGGVAGAAAAAVFGAESLSASVAAATIAGGAGAVAGDATSAGISNQAFTASRALTDLASGMAGGAAGALSGGVAGRVAMRMALTRNMTQRAITNIGTVCSGVTGGVVGAAAAAGVTSARTGQPFFSASTALNMGTGFVAGGLGAFLTSGAYLGKLSAHVIPVALSREEIGLITPAVRPLDYVSPRELRVMAPQAEADASRRGFDNRYPLDPHAAQKLLPPAGNELDTIAAHGMGNTVMASVDYPAGGGAPNFVRPIRNDLFVDYLRGDPAVNRPRFGPAGEAAGEGIKLMVCYGGWSTAQKIANALGRNVFAGYGSVDRYAFRDWTTFRPQ